MAGCPECGRSYNSVGLWIMEAAWCSVLQARSPVPQAEEPVSCPYSACRVSSCSHLMVLGVCEWWRGCGVSLWFMLLMWFNVNVMFSEKPRMRTKWTDISILINQLSIRTRISVQSRGNKFVIALYRLHRILADCLHDPPLFPDSFLIILSNT